MAKQTNEAAMLAHTNRMHRSAASRYYYAAYQAVTALFHYIGLNPPTIDGQERQSWSHADAPEMLNVHLRPYVGETHLRLSHVAALRELYRARVIADYTTLSFGKQNTVDQLRRFAGMIIRSVSRIVSGGAN